MKFLSILLRKNKKRKPLVDRQQEILVAQGREQFKKLVDRGLTIPVVLL